MFRKAFENIRGIVAIRQQERKLFRSLFLHSFLIGVASSLYFLEASRNFILKISIAEMPSAYIVSGLTGYLLVRVLKTLQKKYGVVRSFECILLIFLFAMLLLYAGRAAFDANVLYAKALAYAGFVLMFVFATLFAVGFAGICLMIFNFSQSKRLIALVGTGEILASILTYLLAPVLIGLIGESVYLLLLSACFTLLAIWPIRKLSVVKSPVIASTTGHVSAAKFGLGFIWSDPFILYLSLTTLFSIISVYFIDYAYLVSVRFFSQTTGIEIATIVALLFSVIKTGELFFSLFSSNIIARVGMKTAVVALPWLLVFGAVMAVFSVVFFHASPVFMIVFLFINKWTDRVVRKGVTIPSMKIMFQINSPELRVQLQNNIDGLISQLATIVCGALLMGVCLFESTADHFRFLRVTTVVCLLVFFVFLLTSHRLFRIYKKRIQDYLRSKHSFGQRFGERKMEQQPVSRNSEANALSPATEKLDILLGTIDLSNQRQLKQLICHYNPSLEAYIHFQDADGETLFSRKITKLYFDNQNLFSRTLIVSYILSLDFTKQLGFYKDTWRVTPLRLRHYFLRRLSLNGTVPASALFGFMEMVSDCVNEILWTESSINDLGTPADRRLVVQLKNHQAELTNFLLCLLQLMHDQGSIQLIADMLNKKDRSEEDTLFAVELLENILRPELKKMILPVFEPISFAARRNKLAGQFFFTELDRVKRLQDVLMHDFNTLDSYTKQLALDALAKVDPAQTALKAFSESSISNLRAIATAGFDGGSLQAVYLQKENIVDQWCRLLALDRVDRTNITRWAVYDEKPFSVKTGTTLSIADNTINISLDGAGNNRVEIDLLAMVILHKMRDSFSSSARQSLAVG